MFSKQYLEPETVAAQRAKGYWLGHAKKSVQWSKSAIAFNHFLFGNKSILYYLKTYPTFDVLAATFGLPRSKACEHAHRLAKALERTLRTQGVLPARAIDSLAQMQQVFAGVPVLLLDATERPRHRPRAVVDRAADYSGKKKTDP